MSPVVSVTAGRYCRQENAEKAVEKLRAAFAGHFLTARPGFDIGAAPASGEFEVFIQADVSDEEGGRLTLAELAMELVLRHYGLTGKP